MYEQIICVHGDAFRVAVHRIFVARRLWLFVISITFACGNV